LCVCVCVSERRHKVEQSGLDEWRLSVGTEIKGQIRRLTQKQRETTRVDKEEKEEQ